MKVLILFVVFVLLISCSKTQLIKQGSNSETVSNNSIQGKRYNFADTLISEEPPYVIRKAHLEYPAFAQRNGIEGFVILQAEVFTDGTVGRIEILQSLMSGPGGLDEAAINSVKKWKFSSAKSKGKPVNCWITIPIKFELK